MNDQLIDDQALVYLCCTLRAQPLTFTDHDGCLPWIVSLFGGVVRRTVPETAGNSVHFGAEVMQTVSTLSLIHISEPTRRA